MTRQFLEKGHKLNLLGKDDAKQHTYVIKDKLNHGEYGSSCLCYVAYEEATERLVVLKEFYPEHITGFSFDFITRDENGKLNIPVDTFTKPTEGKLPATGLQRCFYDFCKNVDYAKRLLLNKEISESICFFADVQLLYGNGTYYYENRLIDKSISWLDFAKQSSTSLDEILIIASEIMSFTKKLHKIGLVNLDLKPEDVLIRYDDIRGEFLLNDLYFFDLDGLLEVGGNYVKSELKMTKLYSPVLFEESSDTEIVLTDRMDYSILGNILSLLLKNKLQQISDRTKKALMAYLDDSMRGNLAENELQEKFGEILKNIKEEQYNDLMRKVLPQKEKRYNIIRIGILLMNIVVYSILGYTLFSHRDVKLSFHVKTNILIFVILIALVLLVTGLKILNSLLCEKIARIKISCHYYERMTSRGKVLIRTGEFNTFRHGWRRYSTYQDNSKNNMRRQHLRRILWAALAIAVLYGFGLSIWLSAAPVFFAFGLSAILIFVYSDLFPSTRFFYHNCQVIPEKMRKIIKNHGMERAYYHKYEYLNTKDHPFDINHDYYIKNNRNLFEIKNNLCKEYYTFNSETITPIERFRIAFNYDHRHKFYQEHEIKVRMQDLKFEPLHIRHIYKQSFDRMRNQQVTVGLSLIIMLAFSIFLSTMNGVPSVAKYFMISDRLYFPLMVSIMAAVFLISLFQILYAFERERRVSDVSYKSRYASDHALNELLIQDIVQGIVKPIDIVRGINQTEGYIYTYRNDTLDRGAYNRIVRTMRSRQKDYNRRMLHHDIFANRVRLTITLWLLFGIVFSLLVWWGRCYTLFFPLLLIALILYAVFWKWIIPQFWKKKMICNIKKILEENEK